MNRNKEDIWKRRRRKVGKMGRKGRSIKSKGKLEQI